MGGYILKLLVHFIYFDKGSEYIVSEGKEVKLFSVF